VEDLVGVRITDAAEETRIGERPLDCMALANERVAKALEIGIENFQTARIVGTEAVLAANDVQRRALVARAIFPTGLVPRGRQRSRPAIIK